jgi:hypothetical protein
MAGEIRRVGKNLSPTRPEPVILGQHEIRSEPQIIDKRTGVEPTPAEVHRNAKRAED